MEPGYPHRDRDHIHRPRDGSASNGELVLIFCEHIRSPLLIRGGGEILGGSARPGAQEEISQHPSATCCEVADPD